MVGSRKYSNVYVGGVRLLTIFLIVVLALTSLAGTALAQDDPYVYVDDNVQVYLNDGSSSFWVPVRLDTVFDVSAVAFGLNYNESCLTFDNSTDSNNDGVPDSIRKLHAGFTYEVQHADKTGDGRSEVIVVARANTQGAGGLPVTMDLAAYSQRVTDVRFDVLPGCRTTDGSTVQVNFEFATNNWRPRLPSVSDNLGNSLATPPMGDHIVDGAYVLHFNSEPTEVYLNGGTDVDFAENQSAGTVVGALTNNDSDVLDTHVYAFDDCLGNDNFAFSIDGDQLKAMGPFDYEDGAVLGGDHSFSVCVSATDDQGAAAVGAFTVNVTDINEAPEDIQLDNTSINEGEPSGSPVGNLTTIGDPDAGETHVYDLPGTTPPQCPGPDNASFAINGSVLESAAVFNVETQDLYVICVRSTDIGANEIYRSFTIEVWDENEAPIAVDDPDEQVIMANTGDAHVFDVLANDTDPEGDPLKVGSVAQPTIGFGTVVMTDTPIVAVAFTPVAGYSGPVEFTYQAQEDTGWLELSSNDATVSLYVVSDEDRGDCNNDGEIDAADFSATQLEMWDLADPLDWKLIYQGTYAGSPVGCDSNSSRNGLDGTDEAVDIADVTCTVRLFFQEECAPIMGGAIGAPSASLSVGSHLKVSTGETVNVPIILDTSGQTIVSSGMKIKYDPALFDVDPDAITFNVSEGVMTYAKVNEKYGIIYIAIASISMPMPELEDGVIANIPMKSKVNFSGTSPVDLVDQFTSLSTDRAVSVAVNIKDGWIQLGDSSLYLPLFQMP